MKYKFLIPIALSIIIGLFFGKVFFDNYDNSSVTVFDEKDKIFMLQYGVYEDENQMENAFKDYKKYLYIKNDEGIHLYIGITKSSENIQKIKELYEKQGNNIYVKEEMQSNKSFISVLKEYDKIINLVSDKDIDEIQRIIISNYKEMVLGNEN